MNPSHPTSPTPAPLDLHDLVELSVLDAMGLLDEEERVRFELAFRAAPPPVQAQVRREQARLSRIESLLPDVSPPPHMRAAVVDAVRREIEASRSQDLDHAQALPMLRSRGVSPLWRAAAVGLLAASVTFGVVTFRVVRLYEQTADQVRGNQLVSLVGDRFGDAYVRDVLFSRDTARLVFTRSGEAAAGDAALFVNPEWRSAKFFCNAMTAPDGRQLRLAIIDEKGNVVRELRRFTSQGGVEGFDVNLQAGDAGRVAVLLTGRDGTPEVMLAHADLPRRV